MHVLPSAVQHFKAMLDRIWLLSRPPSPARPLLYISARPSMFECERVCVCAPLSLPLYVSLSLALSLCVCVCVCSQVRKVFNSLAWEVLKAVVSLKDGPLHMEADSFGEFICAYWKAPPSQSDGEEFSHPFENGKSTFNVYHYFNKPEEDGGKEEVEEGGNCSEHIDPGK